jgi:DNA-binding NtrC family response regulator
MHKTVLVLDDDDDLRETLAELIELFGYRCVSAASLAQVVTQRDAALGCDLAILDINLGPGEPSGIDVYHWLKHEHFAGTVLFLTGHARNHPLVRAACQVGARMLEKPISATELRFLLDRGGA